MLLGCVIQAELIVAHGTCFVRPAFSLVDFERVKTFKVLLLAVLAGKISDWVLFPAVASKV